MEKGLTKMRLDLKAFVSKHALLMSGTNVEFSVNYVNFITLNFVLIEVVCLYQQKVKDNYSWSRKKPVQSSLIL